MKQLKSWSVLIKMLSITNDQYDYFEQLHFKNYGGGRDISRHILRSLNTLLTVVSHAELVNVNDSKNWSVKLFLQRELFILIAQFPTVYDLVPLKVLKEEIQSLVTEIFE